MLTQKLVMIKLREEDLLKDEIGQRSLGRTVSQAVCECKGKVLKIKSATPVNTLESETALLLTCRKF